MRNGTNGRWRSRGSSSSKGMVRLSSAKITKAAGGLLRHHRRHTFEGESRYGASFQIDDADAVGVGVGDVQLAVGITQAAGLIEGWARQPTAAVAAKKSATLPGVRVEHLDLAVVRVGHVQL